jgi:hypothetical protein
MEKMELEKWGQAPKTSQEMIGFFVEALFILCRGLIHQAHL